MQGIIEGETTIGNYLFLRVLGHGAFAAVYKAQNIISKTYVAIKVITKASIAAEDAKTRFNREVFLLREMRHPFISEFFEQLEDETNHYLVIEYVENGNLLDFINTNGRITEPVARRYFSQLIYVLEYLHFEKKVAHRDLKAENVMLDKFNNIRVIDFGLSNQFLNTQNLETACGSPAYAAPEMVKGNPYTKAADIWSSGILLYSMVAGRLPYDDNDTQRLLQKIVYTDVHYPGFMSPALVDLLRKMLSKNPDTRITIERIKEHYWFSQTEYELLTGERMKQALQLQSSVDREVIDQMASLGIDLHSLPEQIICNDFNSNTALYRMLAKEKLAKTVNEISQSLKTNGQKAQPKMTKIAFPPSMNSPQKVVFDQENKGVAARPLFQMPGAQKRLMPGARGETPHGGPSVLKRPAPIQIAERRLSRPVAIRKHEYVPNVQSASHETPN